MRGSLGKNRKIARDILKPLESKRISIFDAIALTEWADENLPPDEAERFAIEATRASERSM